MPKLSKNPSIVVVGGGLAGLAAGAYLARVGLRPTVIERASTLGGRGSTRRRGDYSFNVGPHALYRGGAAVAVLRDLGISYTGGVPSVDGLALHRGRFHRLPISPGSLFRTSLIGFRAKLELARVLRALPHFDPASVAHLSVRQWLDEHIGTAEARSVFSAFVRLSSYVDAPEVLSAATALSQLQRAQKNVIYVDDGWQSIVDKLQELILKHRGRIVTGTRVSALRRNDNGTYALQLDGAPDEGAGAVILATEPRDAGKLIQTATGDFPESFRTAVPVRACTLDVALDRLPNSNRGFVLGIDEPLYLSVHSRVARLAPDGGALVHTLKYLPLEETDPEADRRQLEALLDSAQPGWREVACEVQFLPRIKVATWLERAGDGSFARPEARCAELPGVFFAGDWVRSNGWLADGSFESARAVVPEVVDHLKWARAA